jgi:hypothetical protein|tara:strand:- start:741 stop:1445 length:705 start_codon:yes stop_codon:yes gene_type:complete
MDNICTVLTGTKYSVDDVNKLYHSLKKNTTKQFKYYCYTDHTGFDKNVNIIPITKNDKKLQWYKLDYFKKNIIDGKNIILMDIDQVIVGNCDFLFDKINTNEFRGTHRFWWRWREDNQNKKFALSGSIYKFKNGEHEYIVNEFEKDIEYWQQYFIQKGITSGPVNGEQHFVQQMLEDNKTNISMFPEKHIIKWHKDDFYIQTCIEHDYKKWTNNKYVLDKDWHEDVRVVHYAGN